MTKILNFLIRTHIGRILLLLILTPLFLFISDNINNDVTSLIFFILHLICTGALLVYMLIFIVFAWIINPIREYKERKKLQNK